MRGNTLSSRRIAAAGTSIAGIAAVAISLAPTIWAVTAPEPPAAAVRKSVQVLADPNGSIDASRQYTQVSATGNGTVTIVDPVSGSLRNLDGFSTPPVTDNRATYTIDVDGEATARTLQDFPKGQLPITITPTATLDGVPTPMADLVGKSGLLKVTYKIENTTEQTQDITWTGGDGKPVTKSIDVPLPYVGTMALTLPPSYTQISAPGASGGGDGRGNTQLSYTLILFEPLGGTTAEVGYEARISNADVPQVDFTFLPTAPKDNPSTASAQEQYKGGQQTGADLTAGAVQIDTNLLKLAAGAGTLMAGLQKLYDGSAKLNTGLADTAVPGAKKLAGGAGELSSGLSGKLAPGAAQIASGLRTLKSSLKDLPGTVEQNPDFQTLIASFDAVIEAIGKPTDAPKPNPADTTLLGALNGVSGGLAQVDSGLVSLKTGIGQAKGGVDQVNGGLGQLAAGVGQAKGGVDQSKVGVVQSKAGTDLVKAGLDDALAAGGSIGQLDGGVGKAKATSGCSGDPVCAGTLAAVQGGLGQLRTKTTAASDGLGQVSTGLGQVSTGLGQVSTGLGLASGGLTQSQGGLTQVSLGLGQASAGIGAPATAGTLRNGLAQLKVAVNSIKAGVYAPCSTAQPDYPDQCGLSQVIGLLQAGVFSLVDSIASSLSGSGDLGKLVAGGQTLAAGVQTAADGSTKVANGAKQLSAGLVTAADGSGQIKDGLGQAEPGAGKLESGANQLSTEGTKKLVVAGSDTTNSFGEKYATMEALNVRSATGAGIPNGKAAGSNVTTYGVFSYTLAGSTGAENRNGLRLGLAALLFVVAGAAGTALWARR